MTVMNLPRADGSWQHRKLKEPTAWPKPSGPMRSRVAFAAAHVVADPLGDNTPGRPPVVDWDATLEFRRHLYSCGLGVAEAMDTAQRGMGLDWATTKELIRRSCEVARDAGGRIAAGAGTDHAPASLSTLEQVATAYAEQIHVVQTAGARVVLMASRQLARVASGPTDYIEVYSRLLAEVSEPVILHWLGPMFDPALTGYWGSPDVAEATDVLLELITHHAGAVDGVKVSLLDADHERAMRAALPAGVRLYTGDDFNYPDLIRGDATHHSDALLGIFAAIAPAASAAIQALDADKPELFDEILRPTLPLARHIFATPTYNYKVGIAFMAWLSGYQPGFTMVGGLHSARSIIHLAELAALADDACLFPDPDLAAHRMASYLEVGGLRP